MHRREASHAADRGNKPTAAEFSVAPLRKGSTCQVTGGEHAGRSGQVSAVDADGDVYVKLDDGVRVVLPQSLLRGTAATAHVAQAPAADTPTRVESDAPLPSASATAESKDDAAAASGDVAVMATSDEGRGACAGACATRTSAPSMSARANPAVDSCLTALRDWPDGACAVTLGMTTETDALAAPQTRALMDGIGLQW